MFQELFSKMDQNSDGSVLSLLVLNNSNIINITICVSTSDSEDQSTPQDGVSRPVHCDLHEGPGPSHHPHQGLLVILLFGSRCKLYLPRCYQTNIQSDIRKYNFLLQFIAAQQDHDLLGILMVLTNFLHCFNIFLSFSARAANGFFFFS